MVEWNNTIKLSEKLKCMSDNKKNGVINILLMYLYIST